MNLVETLADTYFGLFTLYIKAVNLRGGAQAVLEVMKEIDCSKSTSFLKEQKEVLIRQNEEVIDRALKQESDLKKDLAEIEEIFSKMAS